jgi:deoxyxylulose-5-phosphate synthase
MTEQNTALSVFTESTNLFSTLPNTGSRADKVKIYNTLQNPDKALSDVIGQSINVVHMIAHEVELVSEGTGEIEKHFRVILVDENGVSYASVSDGITNSLKQIFNIVGEPPFIDEPLQLRVLQKKGKGNNKFLTLELL